jgi:hypothetical protein
MSKQRTNPLDTNSLVSRRGFLAASLGIGALALANNAGTAVGRFEVLHASPDAPPVDLYIGGFQLQSGLSYTQFSRRFVINTGTYGVRVFPAGADRNSPPLRDIPIPIEPNSRTLLCLVNVFASLEGVAYAEPAAPPAGQATIRFINLEPGSPPLDVVDVTNGANNVLLTAVAFKEQKSITIPQANLQLQLRQTGTPNVVMTIAATNFPGGVVSTLIKFAPEPATDQARARSVTDPQPRPLVLRRTK